jgi:hypothetical protein
MESKYDGTGGVLFVVKMIPVLSPVGLSVVVCARHHTLCDAVTHVRNVTQSTTLRITVVQYRISFDED